VRGVLGAQAQGGPAEAPRPASSAWSRPAASEAAVWVREGAEHRRRGPGPFLFDTSCPLPKTELLLFLHWLRASPTSKGLPHPPPFFFFFCLAGRL
jgi:hypothetical protein